MITEPVDAGVVEVVAGHQLGGQALGAMDVVVVVAIPGADRPSCADLLGMQGGKGVDETAIVGEQLCREAGRSWRHPESGP